MEKYQVYGMRDQINATRKLDRARYGAVSSPNLTITNQILFLFDLSSGAVRKHRCQSKRELWSDRIRERDEFKPL